jgi:predicted small integral membrane protein
MLSGSMMRRSTIAALFAALLASACVVVPVTVEGYDSECRLVTHHMELKTVHVGAQQPYFRCDGGNCVVALGVTAVSAVVSGSIVVVGNVVYWAEQRADCLTRL